MNIPRLQQGSVGSNDAHTLQFGMELFAYGCSKSLLVAQRKTSKFQAGIGNDGARNGRSDQVDDHSVKKTLTGKTKTSVRKSGREACGLVSHGSIHHR